MHAHSYGTRSDVNVHGCRAFRNDRMVGGATAQSISPRLPRIGSPDVGDTHWFCIHIRQDDPDTNATVTNDLQRDLARTLGSQYAIDRELGGGGAWRCFLVRDRTLYRDVVVKVLSPERSDGISASRFVAEMRRCAVLQLPQIVPLLVAGETIGGAPYFLVPYVSGATLSSRLADGRMIQASAISIAMDVAKALAFAHAHGVVHLELTPDDVLLGEACAMVQNFGLATALNAARSQSVNAIGGTPVDPRIDVEAWGALAYELFSGTPPFSRRTFTPGGSAALEDHQPRHIAPLSLGERAPTLPAPIAQLVMSCLHSDPARRPQDARGIVAALAGPKTPTRSVKLRAKRRVPLLIAAVVAVALTVGAYTLLRPRAAISARSGAAAGLHTLAFLPMSDASDDTENAYLTSGMTDDVTTLLAQLPTLKVTPRSATAAVREGEEFDPLALGQRLGVESVLETRLRRNGRRLELTAVLTKVSDGTLLFRESFSRDDAMLMQLQDDIVHAVALSFRIADRGQALSTILRPKNSEAYDLAMRARYESRMFSDSALRTGIKLYERAVALDPGSVDAWSGLADCWRRLADDFMPARTAIASGQSAMTRSWALDSTSSSAIATRAIDEFLHQRKFLAAERNFVRALRIDSMLATAPLYADLLLQLGKTDSAVAVMTRAARREPMSRLVARYGPPLLTGVAKMEPLRTACTRAVEVDSASYTFDCLRMELRVSKQWRTYLATCDTLDHACRGVALHRLQREGEAKREGALLESGLRELGKTRYIDPGLVAVWFAQMGDVERALGQLDLALAIDSKYVAHLRDPFFFSEVSADPRFQAFISRAGLP